VSESEILMQQNAEIFYYVIIKRVRTLYGPYSRMFTFYEIRICTPYKASRTPGKYMHPQIQNGWLRAFHDPKEE
jgi:hypothetical protein